jgi:hypothetical protein
MMPSHLNFFYFFLGVDGFFLIFINLPVITGKFSPFTENLLLPVNEIIYRTIITTDNGQVHQNPYYFGTGSILGDVNPNLYCLGMQLGCPDFKVIETLCTCI